MKENNVAVSDDYASIYNDNIDFYYGYEEITDKKGNLLVEQTEDEDVDWAFVYRKDGKVIKHYSSKELEKFSPDILNREVVNYLLAGILKLTVDGILT